jgi:hypothetical protein
LPPYLRNKNTPQYVKQVKYQSKPPRHTDRLRKERPRTYTRMSRLAASVVSAAPPRVASPHLPPLPRDRRRRRRRRRRRSNASRGKLVPAGVWRPSPLSTTVGGTAGRAPLSAERTFYFCQFGVAPVLLTVVLQLRHPELHPAQMQRHRRTQLALGFLWWCLPASDQLRNVRQLRLQPRIPAAATKLGGLKSAACVPQPARHSRHTRPKDLIRNWCARHV